MQAVDLPCNPSLDPRASDPFVMSRASSPIHPPNRHSSQSPEKEKACVGNNAESESIKENDVKNGEHNGSGSSSSVVVGRRERLSRACTQRAAARLQAVAEADAEAAMVEKERRRKKSRRRERLAARLLREESDEGEESREEEEEENGGDENGEEEGSSKVPCSRIVTPLVGEPETSQLPRWKIRSMWQLASILNFMNVFRHLLNIKVEFSAEEFETALISPNNTLADIHMPLLKAIPPVTRMALGRHTWITVLCRKLRDWWLWVAEGDLPIVASHGTEVEKYHALDPGVRVVILKALCDIRVEQEDIRSYIDDSIKKGVHLSAFRKERVGGDSYGVSYWYEDDSIIGHRLYREIRKVEVNKGKGRNIPPISDSSYQWEAVATNLDEFLTVSDKLFSSKNRTEVSIGKKMKNNMLPEIEKVHKRKEKLLKKQHRQALMLDSMISVDGLALGRSLRDRKPVTYTFDDYDRSINEAIKVTKKKQSSPEPLDRRDPHVKLEVSENGKWVGPSQCSQPPSSNDLSPKLPTDNEFHEDKKTEPLDLDRSNRRRQRPQRYSEKEFVEELPDNNADFDSDDDIVGEVVYHDEYIESRKRRKKMSSSSEEEYHWDGENPEEEEGEDEMLSTSEDSDRPRRFKMLPGRPRREMKVRSVDELQLGLRRSKRTTRNRINYRKYEMSGSDTEKKPQKLKAIARHSLGGENTKFSADEKINTAVDPQIEELQLVDFDENQTDPPDEDDSVAKRRYLDLNELAPVSGVDDAPNSAERKTDT